ncbi:MAG: hypothetical protein DSY89_00670 [Deltaproteobacteria bacterium]|nr:MAG: hypothetical protein DSY89_00670 [Deltaproteobacteria bacterium]
MPPVNTPQAADSRRPLQIYLIAPRTPDSFWNMQGTLDAVGVKALMPSVALSTLISLTPPEVTVQYHYCDENVSTIDWELACDLVAISGFTLHAKRIAELFRKFGDRGIPVALGGALATLDTELARPMADHLFVGEAEYTWPAFLKEFSANRARPVYIQKNFVDINDSPPPDWTFINGKNYLYMAVQTARGCPNHCDFCDAVRLIGHKHRCKPIDQVITEVNSLYKAGCEVIFFSDDNFMVSQRYTKKLLQRLIEWNTSLPHPVQFACQTDVRITDNETLLQLMADARFSAVFLGIESLRRECLEEISKGHLYRPDMTSRIRRMAHYGLLPFIGLIVGFDADDENTFDEIELFLNEAGIPTVSISVLNAPEGTPLHERLLSSGRIDEQFAGVWHFSTNIVPLSGSRKEMLSRHRRLFLRLYEPGHFESRTLRWLRQVGYFPSIYIQKRRPGANLLKIGRIIRHYTFRVPAPVRRTFFSILYQTFRIDPQLVRKAITIMTQYCHYYTFVSDKSYRGVKH